MAVTINPEYTQQPEEQPDTPVRSSARALVLRWETIAIIVLLLAAIFTRFYDLGARAMSHDESLHVYYSYRLYQDGDFAHTPLMHGPILFHMTALSYSLFGDNDFTGRIYTAVLGVLMVMSPLLFRRWLGRWGAVLASLMILISPLLLYYNRYIRHDTPAILSSILMAWAIFMYLDGPAHQKRKPHWLYILAIGMIWNLGSKETSFFYIGSFGLFLTIYWLIRMAQQAWDIPGRVWFTGGIMGALLAGFTALGFFVILDIIPLENLSLTTPGLEWINNLVTSGGTLNTFLWLLVMFAIAAIFIGITAALVSGVLVASRRLLRSTGIVAAGVTLFFGLIVLAMAIYNVIDTALLPFGMGDLRSFVSWSLVAGLAMVTVFIGTLLWALRAKSQRIPWRDILTVLFIAVLTLTVFIVIEEQSHISREELGISTPAVPDQEGAVTEEGATVSTISWSPIIAVWGVAIFFIALLGYSRRAGWWHRWFDRFPEFDVLMTMGALLLPWITAIFTVMARGTPDDYTAIALAAPEWLRGLVPAPSLFETGRFFVGFLVWLPLFTLATFAGLIWNWKRFAVTTLIFHAIFAFFFTTMFSNMQGLATGMVGSLGYWLEQQAERRGDQPQYYYLLIILPMYEYLPIIGSFLAMIGGSFIFWKQRLRYRELEHAAANAVLTAEDAPAGSQSAALPEYTEQYDADGEPKDKRKNRFDTLVITPAWTEFMRLKYLTRVPFLLFMAWWAILNLIVFTLAGEKMPWLGTHMSLPMIFLTGWFFGRVVKQIDWAVLTRRGWIVLLLTPALLIALARLVAIFFTGQSPFAGVGQTQLQATYEFLAALVFVVFLAVVAVYFARQIQARQTRLIFGAGVFALLAVITFRAAWMASFINYDYATEFLVYAHATPGTKIVMDQIEDISRRTTDGMDIVFAYDDRMNWPGVWYFREYPKSVYMGSTPTLQQMEQASVVLVGEANRGTVEPLLEDRYQRFDYQRMWWPMMDYFGLTAQRMNSTFDFSPANTTAAQVRRGLLDIWWSRDYTTYGTAVGRDFSVTNWPVSERMSMYVRRDIAAQVWNYGIGEGTPITQGQAVEVSACVANWQDLSASVVFDTANLDMNLPVGIDVGPDGRVYVAEDGNSRISVFNDRGQFLEMFGQRGTADQVGAFFERPNSVAVAQDGTIIVADTWNYRIRTFDADYNPLTQWGTPITAGIAAQVEPRDGFWGPRDVEVDNMGNVYVSDTGNKRVRVYDMQGNWLRDIGSGGSGPGQLDEPSGLAAHPDGRLFVADTWNRRISVFNADGTFLTTYNVRAWYEELGNRPYLAIDAERGYLYVTDPDAGRILVYTTEGECVGAFGRLNRENPLPTQFSTIGGLAVDSNGYVYVVDVASKRVLKFEPFPTPQDVPQIDGANSMDESTGGDASDSGELPSNPETTAEVAP